MMGSLLPNRRKSATIHDGLYGLQHRRPRDVQTVYQQYSPLNIALCQRRPKFGSKAMRLTGISHSGSTLHGMGFAGRQLDITR